MEFNLPVLLIGIFFFAIGVLLLVKEIKKKKNSTSAALAEVASYFTSVSSDEDGGETYSYFPVMRYYIAGKCYEQKSDTGSGKKKYEIGQKVNILYNPDNPNEFMIEGDKNTFIAAVIGIILGLGAIILSFFAH